MRKKSATNVAFGPILGYLCSEDKALRNKKVQQWLPVIAVVYVYKQTLWKKVISFRAQQMQLKKRYIQEYSVFILI